MYEIRQEYTRLRKNKQIMQNWIRFDKLNKVGQMLNFNNASTKPLKSSAKSINEDSISSIIWLFHNVFVKYEGNHNLEKFFSFT